MTNTSEHIVDAANRLFYEQGFERTSFANIAQKVGISRGNFYYHFKTKDEILTAVIEARLATAREMLSGWLADTDSPLERILKFSEIVVTNQQDIERYGCPVGTLSGELAKLGHPARPQAVGIFQLFRDWLGEQFDAAGAGEDSDSLALHVLTFSQGVATLSNAFGDRTYVQQELRHLESWLREHLNHGAR